MESFTIQCTSCESRIRVRNPNMIGQIANCPKCGSMILIAAPQQITVDSGNPTDSVAVTREALPKPDESLLKPSSVFETGFRMEGLPPGHSKNVDLAHSAPPDDEYRLAADPLAEDPFREAMASGSVANSNESSSDALPLGAWLPEAAASDPMPPPKATDVDASIQAVRAKRQESAARSRHVMLVATIALCSVLIAIGILFAFLRWIAKPNVVANNTAPAAGMQPLKPDQKNTDVAPAEPGNDLPGSQPEVPGNTNVIPDNGLPSPANPPANPAMPAVEAAPVEGNPPAGEPPAAGPTTVGNASTTKRPLGGSIAPSLDSVLAPNAEDQPKGDVPTELPPGLQGFSRLFNQGFEPVLSDASVPLDKATEVPADADNGQPNQNAAPAVANDTIPAIVDKRLSMQLSGMLISERPLPEALTTLALIGEVPVVADLDSLAVVGVSKSTMVKVKATSAVTLEAVLNSIAVATKIRWVPWENRVIYARASDEDLETRLPKVIPVADLVSTAAERDQLLQGLKDVLPQLGDALQVTDEGLQLTLTPENGLAWFQLARLLETWRVARGITNESTSAMVPKSSLLPAWPVEAMQQAAKMPIKQVVPSEPIARTWQRLTGDARVFCWVDWHGLQMADTNPRQKATVITLGRPLSELLQHYATKYQVVFAIDDARSLWVTSPEMHRMQPRLYVLPLAEKNLEEWTAELEPLAPIHPTTGASLLKLVPTPDGQYLFVCCCRPILVEPQ